MNYIDRLLLQNRWIVVLGAVLIQLALGAIYAWSVFTQQLTDQTGVYRFSASQTAWIFSAGLFTFSLVMALTGKWQRRFGPTIMSLSGGALLGLGYVLGGLYGDSFINQFLFIGIIGGAGIGFTYAIPIAVGVRWFPDKKGVVTGFAVAGFGFGAMIWVMLANSWFGGLLNTLRIAGLPPVQSVFILYGLIFTLMVSLGSIVMRNPADDYVPLGWRSSALHERAGSGNDNYTVQEMFLTPQFYGIWFVFMSAALAGLMVIYCIKLFGIDALEYRGVLNAGEITAVAMGWYAIANGIGRIVWGAISEHTGRQKAIIAMTLLQGVVLLMTYHVFITFGYEMGFILVACLIGFNFGGNFALFPAITADFFGNRAVGANYGWVFTAYGVAGILGPTLAGHFKDLAVGGGPVLWMVPFVIAGVACFVGASVMFLVHVPQKRAVNTNAATADIL